MNKIYKLLFGTYCVALVSLTSIPSVHAVAVDCDLGGLIQPQLDLGNSVEFTGTCDEDLFIITNETILNGGAAATSIIQGDVTVEAAQRVVLTNLTVKNAIAGDFASGVVFRDGASVDVVNATFDDLFFGFCVLRNSLADIFFLTSTTQVAFDVNQSCTNLTVADDSVARMTDSTITNNLSSSTMGAPVYANRNSTLALRGGNSITNTGAIETLAAYHDSHIREDNGVSGTGNTVVGTTVGVLLFSDSSLDIRQITLTAPDNLVQINSTLRIGSDAFGGDPANISVNGDITASEQSTVNIHPNSAINGTVKCESHSTLDNHVLSGASSVNCPYNVTQETTARINIRNTSAIAASRTMLELRNSGRPKLKFNNVDASTVWIMSNGANNFRITRQGSGDTEFKVKNNGNMVLAGTSTAVNHINSSSRKLKQGFQRVSQQEILDKVDELEISQWNYKRDSNTLHVGPMAEDFQAIFDLGDGTHISTVDTAGITLAAIQGLRQEKDMEIELLKLDSEIKSKEIAALKSELSKIKIQLRELVAGTVD